MTVDIQMLYTPGCRGCAKARNVLDAVQKDYDINVTEADLTERPELAQEYGVMTAPGIVIDGELAFQGGVTEKQLRQALDKRSE